MDPLDGTTNFVHGYQFCCVCIGFAVNGELSVGVVYIPMLDELFTAATGRGAFLNGERIHVTRSVTLESAMLVNNIGAGRHKAFVDVSMECVRRAFMANCHAVRMTGRDGALLGSTLYCWTLTCGCDRVCRGEHVPRSLWSCGCVLGAARGWPLGFGCRGCDRARGWWCCDKLRRRRV